MIPGAHLPLDGRVGVAAIVPILVGALNMGEYAYDFTGVVYNYYLEHFERRSVDNNDKPLESTVKSFTVAAAPE